LQALKIPFRLFEIGLFEKKSGGLKPEFPNRRLTREETRESVRCKVEKFADFAADGRLFSVSLPSGVFFT